MIRAAPTSAGASAPAGRRPPILEGFVDFVREISVIAARGRDGAFAAYPTGREPARAPHPGQTIAPADSPPDCRRGASAIAARDRRRARLCRRAGGRDVRDSRRRRRGCWSTRSRRASTIPATGRSTARRPASSSSMSAPSPACRSARRRGAAAVEMDNLIGDEAERWREHRRRAGRAACISTASRARPGRKMGHVTRGLSTRRRAKRGSTSGLGIPSYRRNVAQIEA